MTPPAVAAAGGIIIDNMVAADGRVRRRRIGGNAVYAAAGARLWTSRTALIGCVPANYPQAFLDRLAGRGIDVGGVARASAIVPVSEWFFHRPDGSRIDHLHATEEQADRFAPDGAVVEPARARTFEAELAATAHEGPTFVAFRAGHPPQASGIPGAFRGTGGGLHCGPTPPRDALRLLEAAKAWGLRATWDPGFTAAALAAGGPGEARSLLAAADAVLPSEKELALLAPGLPPAEAAESLLHQGARLVVAKLGGRGSLVSDGNGARPVPACAVAAPDPTGAGDAFCGGFLAGWLATGDPVAGAMAGTVSASFAVQDFGPDALLDADRAEARARLSALCETCPGTDPTPLFALLDQERP